MTFDKAGITLQCDRVCKENPALWFGLLFTAGIFISFGYLWAFLPVTFLFIFTSKKLYHVIVFVPLVSTPFFLQIPKKENLGTGVFKIQSIEKEKRGYSYRGHLLTFKKENSEECIAKNLPCRIFAKEEYPATNLYTIHGLLKKKRVFYLKPDQEFIPRLEKTPLTHFRLQAKQKVAAFLHDCFKDPLTAAFFITMTTGGMEDPALFRAFSETGLVHLLAISGFHFSLLVYFLQGALHRFLPTKALALVLITCLTLYLFFLGSAPSVLRAWTGATFFYLSHLVDKRSFSLNTLGIALILVLLVHPLYALHLGFQLSFLATAGLLLLTQPIERFLQIWLPSRPFHAVIDRSLFFQHFYVIRSLFRKSLATSCAAQVAITPVLLSTFHFFAWHHFIYNLFVPPLIGLLFWVFLIFVPFCLLAPPLKIFLMHPLGAIVAKILNFIEICPLSAMPFTVESFPTPVVAITLTLLFSLSLFRIKN